MRLALAVDLEEDLALGLNGEAEALGVNPMAAEHALDRDRAEGREQRFQRLGVERHRLRPSLRAPPGSPA